MQSSNGDTATKVDKLCSGSAAEEHSLQKPALQNVSNLEKHFVLQMLVPATEIWQPVLTNISEDMFGFVLILVSWMLLAS